MKEKQMKVFGADSGRRLRRGVWVPQKKREKERKKLCVIEERERR